MCWKQHGFPIYKSRTKIIASHNCYNRREDFFKLFGLLIVLAFNFNCLQISRMHSKLSSEKWILDQSSIFAQVDAFVQRCKDLLEVLWCALYCQLQFVEQN